jgi:hypothetical protein
MVRLIRIVKLYKAATEEDHNWVKLRKKIEERQKKKHTKVYPQKITSEKDPFCMNEGSGITNLTLD